MYDIHHGTFMILPLYVLQLISNYLTES